MNDILDVVGDEATLGKPVGSDTAQGKSTYPALLVTGVRVLAQESVDAAVSALDGFAHPRADFLRAVALHRGSAHTRSCNDPSNPAGSFSHPRRHQKPR